MKSLRTKLIAGLIGGITLFLAVSGFATYGIVSGRLIRQFDDALRVTAGAALPLLVRETLSDRFEGGPGPRGPRGPRGRPGEPAGEPFRNPSERADIAFEVRNEQGASLVKSAVLGDHELPRLAQGLGASDMLMPSANDSPDHVRYAALNLPHSDAPARAITFVLQLPERGGGPRGGRLVGPTLPEGSRFPGGEPGDEPNRPERGERPDPREDSGRLGRPGRPDRSGPLERTGPTERPGPIGPLEVVLAVDASELHATRRGLRWLLLATWLSASLGSAAILSWIVHRSLRPVAQLSQEIEALRDENWTHRVEVANVPSELEPVVTELNALLGRVEEALDREQAFTADAAHELRTPLAGLRSTLELALTRERSADEYKGAADQSLSITLEMQELVADLLQLSRLAVAGAVKEPEQVDLAQLVRAAWDARAERTTARRVALEDSLADTVVTTDATLLRRIIENVVDNAVEYTDEGGTLFVRSKSSAGELVIEFENEAASAPHDVAANALRPFWRADASRHKRGGHAGLGLALCQRIAAQLGGKLTASYSAARFKLRVSLPR